MVGVYGEGNEKGAKIRAATKNNTARGRNSITLGFAVGGFSRPDFPFLPATSSIFPPAPYYFSLPHVFLRLFLIALAINPQS